MVTILAGENSFILRVELEKLIHAFISEQGELALERLDGEDAAYEKILEALTSLPFLASKKMVVLMNGSANKRFTEDVEKLLKDLPETTDLIIVEPKLDKRSSYYKFLKKETDFREFIQMEGSGLAQWITETAKELGGKLELRDAQYLIDRVGANQQALSHEIEKLVLYESNITRTSIDLLTEATPQSTIFQLLDVAFNGNQKLTLQLYKEQRSLKVEPQQILAMLAWQLHILALVKTAGKKPAVTIAKEAKISPYVVGKSQRLTRGLTMEKLKQLIQDLLTIDLRSKREAFDLDEALQNYLISL